MILHVTFTFNKEITTWVILKSLIILNSGISNMGQFKLDKMQKINLYIL